MNGHEGYQTKNGKNYELILRKRWSRSKRTKWRKRRRWK